VSDRVPSGADEAGTPPDVGGVTVAFMRLTGTFMQHLQALSDLASLEAKEAAWHYLRIVIMLMAALFFAAFGYVFLLLFAAFAIAELAGVSWVWITLGVCVLHFLLTLIAASYVKRNWKTPIFQTLAAELKKDAEALKNAGNEPRSTDA